MANRAWDWLKQAERDLAHAERSALQGDHGWACFAAHQAAKKAVKALHLYRTVSLEDPPPSGGGMKAAARLKKTVFLSRCSILKLL
ncbi:HEPN domain-containing protein [Ammonifex degensii]|uniref:HEPN domain-containing protein n=1 Tax=Ammonifex degensii TaxID=42838 RepID=UPI000A0697D6